LSVISVFSVCQLVPEGQAKLPLRKLGVVRI
jgi:hypothetical protein